ncbi:acyl-ACP--UDP-N-acetylglucosamine O-acyltransferase [bacterium]
MEIDKTAIVDKGAELGNNVSIGPYSVIEPGTTIGDGTEIRSHVVIKTGTRIGPNCRIHHGAVLGGEPQDVKFEGEESYLTIGAGTVIREYVTAHRADGEGVSTEIGGGCMIMVSSHVAHNCRIGDEVTMANLSTLGGFVKVGDRAFLGGLCGVHQFAHIGEYAMVGGGCTVLEDVPPYMMVTGGHRPPVCGLNTVGLMRAGFSGEVRKALKQAYRIMFKQGLKAEEAAAHLKEKYAGIEEVNKIVEFIEATERGISRGR